MRQHHLFPVHAATLASHVGSNTSSQLRFTWQDMRQHHLFPVHAATLASHVGSNTSRQAAISMCTFELVVLTGGRHPQKLPCMQVGRAVCRKRRVAAGRWFRQPSAGQRTAFLPCVGECAKQCLQWRAASCLCPPGTAVGGAGPSSLHAWQDYACLLGSSLAPGLRSRQVISPSSSIFSKVLTMLCIASMSIACD